LLKDLKSKGVTIVLNSHQLDQVEKVCDRVAFIKSGKVDGIEDLQQGPAGTSMVVVRWKTGDVSKSSEELGTLAQTAGSQLLEVQTDCAVFAVPNADVIAETVKQMILAGYKIIQVTPRDSRLERYFIPGQSAIEPPQGTLN